MDPGPNAPRPFEDVYPRYLAGLLDHDVERCREIFEHCLASGAELRSLYEDLVQRSLYEVGDLWERGRISVATEHLATAITERLLALTYPRLFAQPHIGKTAIVACVANEHHQVGGRMVADLFEVHGWRGYFLGANTPVADLTALIAEKRPDVVAFSVAVATSLDAFISAAADVREAYPAGPVLVGGQAFRWGGLERVRHLPGVRCLTTLGELEAWITGGDDAV